MKFVINRASIRVLDKNFKQPHEKAVKEDVETKYKVSYNDIEDYDKYYTNNTFRDKTEPEPNKEILPTGQVSLCYKKIKNLWTIEFDSFEELIAFNKEVGDIILTTNDCWEYPHITIYDDYME